MNAIMTVTIVPWWMPWLDIAAALVLLAQAMRNINHMQRGTKHCFRLLNIGIAVAALGVILTAFHGGEIRYGAHVLITCAMAVLVIIGRRRADRLQGET